jgi:hypothetical protein
MNVVKGKDTQFLSEDLRNSIGRLVMYAFLSGFYFGYLVHKSNYYSGHRGIQDTLEAANKEKSTGFAVYVLVEDDVEVLKNANKKLDELLQCFWVCFQCLGYSVLIVITHIFLTD